MKNKIFSSLFAVLLLVCVVFGSVPAYADDPGIQSDFIFLMTEQKMLLSYELPGTILENFTAFHITYIVVLGIPPDPLDPGKGTFLSVTVTNPTQTYSDLNLFMVAGFFGDQLVGNWNYSDGPFVQSNIKASSSFAVGVLVTFVLFGTEDDYYIQMVYETDSA